MGLGNVKLPRRSEAGGADTMNFVNFIFRVLQFIFGLVILILYATQPAYNGWTIFEKDLKFGLGTAAGALAMATTPFLAIIPFFLGYKPVAWAFVWDFIVMAVYAGTFAYYKDRFGFSNTEDTNVARELYHKYGVDYSRFDTMHAAVILDLIAMLLWLITFLMALGVIIFSFVWGGRPMKN